MNRSLRIAGTTFLIALSQPAWSAGEIPASAMPERVSRSLTTQQQANTVQPVAPTVTEPDAAASALAEQAKKIKFQMNGLVLEGNHVYSTAELEPIYKDKLHQTISVADLFEIVQNITNYYRNNGYIISRAVLPPQHVKGGIVHVQIIEGYLDKVMVTGNPRGAKCLVQGFGRHIVAVRPLELSRMEKYLTLANEVPATDVKAVLSPSKTEAGAADLTLVTENKLFTGYASYDNYGTRYIGPQQMTANIGFNSVINSGDSTQMTYTKTPKGAELTFGDINYSSPWGDEGTRWLLGATRAHTHPLFVLQSQQVDGFNVNYYSNLQIPIIRERTKSLTVQPSFNYMDSEVNQFGNQELYTDHVRSLGISAVYNFADRWYGSNLMSGEFRQGLPILGYTSNQSPLALTSRPGGRGDYTKFGIQMSRLQAIKGPITLYGLFRGQWAFNPLLASEQFSFGGSQLGRGYDTAEIIGDKGTAGSLELRWDVGLGNYALQTMQLYMFYDAGIIWNYKNVGGTPTKQSAISTGAGARFYFTKYISGNVMWAQPLTKEVAALQATKQVITNGITVNDGNGAAPRVFFSVVAQVD